MTESFNALVTAISRLLDMTPIEVKKEIVLTGTCKPLKIHKHNVKRTLSVAIYSESTAMLESLRQELDSLGFSASDVCCDSMSQSKYRYYIQCEYLKIPA